MGRVLRGSSSLVEAVIKETMSNKIKRYALRAVTSLWIIYMAIASFGQHHNYFELLGGILIGFVLFGAGRLDKELENPISTPAQ